MSVPHNFEESLSRSKTPRQRQIEKRKLLDIPLFAGCLIEETDREMDLLGVDYRLVRGSASPYLVDVKFRRTDVAARWQTQPDLAIEWWSRKEHGVRGWTVRDDKLTTHVVYMWGDEVWPDCYVLEADRLRIATIANERLWKARFGVVSVRNESWTTECSFPPASVVIDAVNESGIHRSPLGRRSLPAGSVDLRAGRQLVSKVLYHHYGPEESEQLAYDLLRQYWGSGLRGVGCSSEVRSNFGRSSQTVRGLFDDVGQA